jgi:hypothetical protein
MPKNKFRADAKHLEYLPKYVSSLRLVLGNSTLAVRVQSALSEHITAST